MKVAIKLLGVLLALAGVSQSINAQSTLDLYGSLSPTDPTGTYAGIVKDNGSQKNGYSPTMNVGANYWFTTKLNAENTLKVGALGEVWYGFYSGSKAPVKAGQNVIDFAPQVLWTGYGFTLSTVVKTFFLNPADGSGLNAFSSVNANFVKYGPFANSVKYPVAQNSTVVIPNWLASYKFNFTKDFALSLGVQGDTFLVPVIWQNNVKPQFSVLWGPLQLDSKYNFFFQYYDAKSSPNQYFDFFLEDKLWYDFGKSSIGDFKPYIWVNKATYSSGSKYTSSDPFHGSWARPGVVWTLSNLSVEGYVGFNFFDTTASDSNDYFAVGGVATAKKFYLDPKISVSYRIKF